MKQKFKRFYLHVKKEISLKAYWLLTLILFLITLVRPAYPIKEVYSAYQYQYGIIGSWVTFYQPANYGMKTFWYHLPHNYLGFLFSPSVIFWDSFVIYVGYIILVTLIHGVSGHRLFK